MAYNRQRRAQAAPRQDDATQVAPALVPDEDDRVYTEEDYAVPEDRWAPALPADEPWEAVPDEAFQPDEGDPADTFDPFNISTDRVDLGLSSYSSLDETGDEYLDLDADPLADDLLTDAEQAALRRSHWKLMAGLMDFIGVIVGTAVILLLVMLLVSLINWLLADVNQTFTLWQMRI